MNLSKRSKLIGKGFETNNCGKCFIVDYKSARDVTVVFFEPLYTLKCEMSNLRKGEVYNPFYPKVYGKGYVDAFIAYKKARKIYIREVAEKWKGLVDDKVYEALMSWELLE